MNRTYVLLIIIFLTNNLLFSQNENSNPHFKIGINIGPNYTTLRGDSFSEEYDSKINYFIGLKSEYYINEKISVIANLNYDSKYVKAKFNKIYPSIFFPNNPSEELRIDNELKFKYLNLPILVRCYLGSKNNYFINLGGFYNHLLNFKYIINSGQSFPLAFQGLNNNDLNDFIKTSDFGVSFGFGTSFNLQNKTSLEIEVRNDSGIPEIQKYDFFGFKSIKTNTLRFIINWNFEL